MARAKCPCCGSPFNGKKCSECLYEAFDEVEQHDHPHGTFGVPASQTWKTIEEEKQPVFSMARQEAREEKTFSSPASWQSTQTKRSFSYPTSRKANQRRSSPVGKIILGVFLAPFILTILTTVFMIVVVGFLMATDGFDEFFMDDFFTEEPVISLPDERYYLYDRDGFTILTPWEPNTPIEDDLTLFVENRTDEDVVIHSSMASVNGIMAEGVFFYCDVNAGSTGVGTLWMDYSELGIETVEEVVLLLDFLDPDTYDVITEGVILTLHTGENASHITAHSGDILMDEDDFFLMYEGWEVNAFGDVEFLFYGQNKTDNALSITSSEVLADGISLDVYLWMDYLPNTQGSFRVSASDLSMLDTDDPSEIDKLSFELEIYDFFSLDTALLEQELAFSCNP